MLTSSDAIAALWWQTLAPVLIDALASRSHASAAAANVARVGDPDATRTVYATVVILIALGVVLASLAIWLLRRTRPEPEMLAPLETMQTRRWRKLDPAAQRRSLDESRPAGAVPLRREASPPALDSSFATIAPVASFDDLSAEETTDDPDDANDAGGNGEEGDAGDDAEMTDAPGSELSTVNRDDTGELNSDDEFAIDAASERHLNNEAADDAVDDVDRDVADDIEDVSVVRSIDPLLTPERPSPDPSN